ncbi:MAG: DUF6624 domain-containing protein [Candidatus Paceibacteria bacterium]
MIDEHSFGKIPFSQLADEITNMKEADQEMRRQGLVGEHWDDSIDIQNTNRLKEIVAEIGWPSITKVGANASYNAWLLVQHSYDVAFQITCLNLMKELPVHEVDQANIAYLEDRIRVRLGEAQLYGTQRIIKDGKETLAPIADEIEVNNRRAEMNLPPLQKHSLRDE